LSTPTIAPVVAFPLSCARIAQLLAAPLAAVSLTWPLLEACLRKQIPDIGDLACIAALATIHVECPGFLPHDEQYDGDPKVYFARYDTIKSLGNTQAGDGYNYRGRGLAQITGRYEYTRIGSVLGLDLVKSPALAEVPQNSAAIFATIFSEKHIADAADMNKWPIVRLRWNGGYNGYETFLRAVNALSAALKEKL
jgi:putative chitinase